MDEKVVGGLVMILGLPLLGAIIGIGEEIGKNLAYRRNTLYENDLRKNIDQIPTFIETVRSYFQRQKYSGLDERTVSKNL